MYKVLGADQKEYGPVTAEQVRLWIADRRLNGFSLAQVVGSNEWKPLSQYPEFADALIAAPQASLAPGPLGRPGVSSTGPKTNNMAIAGFVMGLLGVVCCCGFPAGILGVVFSAIGLSQINKDPDQQGKGIAIAGLVLSIISIFASFGAFIFQWPAHFDQVRREFKL